MPELKNKIALITGASAGIGAATALHFASLGCSVAINGRDEGRLAKTLEECIHAGLSRNQVLLVPGDLTEPGVPEKIVQQTIDYFGRLDILVNNAGIVRVNSVTNTSEEEYETLMNVNLKTHFLICKAAAPHLKQSKGNIVNVSSAAAQICGQNIAIYSVSKAAMDHLTRALAQELSAFGVRVNSVNPGVVETEIYLAGGLDAQTNEAIMKQLAPTKHLLGRIGRVDEVAKPIAFLASEDASFITGHCLVIDGGFTITAN